MLVKITGKNLDVGDALRTRAEERLSVLSDKYFDGRVRAHITVEKQRSVFVSECTMHLTTGLVLQAHGEAPEAYGSFEAAASHLEKQLKRYKQRIKNHHRHRQNPVKQLDASSYVIAAADQVENKEEPGDLNPVVIAESSSSVPELSVGEAVMQLDISNIPFVLFRNARSGGLNIVYRRPDGNIGWVEPAEHKSA